MKINHVYNIGESYRLSEKESQKIINSIKQQDINKIDPEILGDCSFSSTTKEHIIDGKYRVLYYINLVIGVKSDNFAFEKNLITGNSKKVIFPYQFSGIVTSPADAVNQQTDLNFFDLIFGNFYRFLVFIFSVPGMLWSEFRKMLLIDGNPENVTKAWKSEEFLEKKKEEIHFMYNPKAPFDFLPRYNTTNLDKILPHQSGLGLFYSRRNDDTNYIYQLYDGASAVSPLLNSRDRICGWYLPEDMEHLYFKWLSKKGIGYASNDGECYGSFLLCEEI